MSSTASLSISPDDQGINNRLVVIKAKDSQGKALEKPAYYLPIGFHIPGTLDGTLSDRDNWYKEGDNFPKRYTFGETIIDVILNGSDSFKKSIPIISALDPDPIKPRTFLEYRYTSSTVSYSFTVPAKDGQALPAVGSFTSIADSRTTLVRIFQLDANIKEVEELGFVNGYGSEYIVFNGQSKQRLPDEAQNVVLGFTNLVDVNGKVVQVDVDTQAGEVIAFANDNGLKKEVSCFGFIKVDYTYKARRYKFNYECKDFKLTAINSPDYLTTMIITSNNKDALKPSFFLIKVPAEAGFITEIFKLEKKAEFIEMATSSDSVNFSRDLTEQSRSEDERTYADEDSGAEIKMKVVKSITLVGQDGKPWNMTFNEQD